MFTARNMYLNNWAYLPHQHNKVGEACGQINHLVSILPTKNYYKRQVYNIDFVILSCHYCNCMCVHLYNSVLVIHKIFKIYKKIKYT